MDFRFNRSRYKRSYRYYTFYQYPSSTKNLLKRRTHFVRRQYKEILAIWRRLILSCIDGRGSCSCTCGDMGNDAGGVADSGPDAEWTVHGVRVRVVHSLDDPLHDAVVAVTGDGVATPAALTAALAAAARLDAGVRAETVVVPCAAAAGGRLVSAALGALSAYDDVRSAGEAAARGVRRALLAGAARPVLALAPAPRWERAPLVQLLAALEALYVPLQLRELFPRESPKAAMLGVYSETGDVAPLVRQAVALEISRGVARDIGGADPERMTPRALAQYVRDVFSAGGDVAVRLVEDPAVIAREYPLFAAVARASDSVPRHRGCIIFIKYEPTHYDRAVYLVGKGVTYDTGGCDIKTGGSMSGMSRDKCGAAACVGFLKACELLRPPLKAVAALAATRNSVGEEAYVTDELVMSRGGALVAVGNTDAEGRLVMADLLLEAGRRARQETAAAHVYSVATLTGHAARAYGPYSALVDNATARAARHADKLAAAGEALGEPAEVSVLRREDVAAHAGGPGPGGLRQAAPQPSVAVPRGHQGPAAFLALAAELLAPPCPPYTHLDVAGAAGSPPDEPTAAPLLALAHYYGLV